MNEFQALQKDIHDNAVAHGWWEGDRPFSEIIALCHSELSEALEEFRDGKPNLYYNCTGGNISRCKPTDMYDCLNYGKESECKHRAAKPEGVAVELADTVIRILDYCGYAGIDIDDILALRRAANDTYTLSELIDECHFALSLAYKGREPKGFCFAECIALIRFWCKENGINLMDVINLKHEYNKTRPYKHGGKVI